MPCRCQGRGVLEKSLPRRRAVGFLVRNSSWEGQTQLVAARGAQETHLLLQGACYAKVQGRGGNRWTVALKRLVCRDVFIIILRYLNYHHGKSGVWRVEGQGGR